VPVRRVTVRGSSAVIRKARKLPRDARKRLDEGTRNLARQFARVVAAAGRADSKQSARAARTVKASTLGGKPAVVVGPHPLLFGSEFGANQQFGWYAHPRYEWARGGSHFRPHQGKGGSYWFFATAEREEPRFAEAHQEMARAVIRDWGA
jgi:hypothetical protein